jgi:hypothetical protein
MGRHGDVLRYLPDERDIDKLPRQFLLNVGFTLIQKPFADWVHSVCSDRHERLAEKKDLFIKMDPEVHRAFMASQAVSSKSPFQFCAPMS